MSSRIGFETLDDEMTLESLPTEGHIPEWLDGTLVRNGPAKFEVGGRSMNHWFDGFAMLHAFRLHDGDVSYKNRFLRSDAYTEATEEGKLTRREFATDPCRSIFKRLFQTFFGDDGTDNACVNVTRAADKHIAMTETPMDVVFDLETLETQGHFDYEDDLGLDTASAHPHFDFDREELLNLGLNFGRTSHYRIYTQPADSAARQPLVRHPVDDPGYMHSFAVTERYVVMTECPWVLNPLTLLAFDKPFAEHFKWKPEQGSRFLVFDRDNGELVTEASGPAMFTFHHVNAWEDRGSLYVDLSAYPSAAAVESLMLDRLRTHSHGDLGARMRRFEIPLNETSSAREHALPEHSLELPRIDYRPRNGRPYRYVWGVGQSDPGEFIDHIVKMNVESGSVETWSEDDAYPGEPVFVPRPDRDPEPGEDDGVILSVVLKGEDERSHLSIMDAADLKEIGRARLPHHIPFGFHGHFYG
jgi:carotenoid cleavage dioxygenase-like enzyme